MTEISRRVFVSSNAGITVIPPSDNNSAHTVRSSSTHDYAKNPMLVYWEMTQACALACRHCRAEAISTPHPGELTHAESKDLLRQIAAFDKPLPHLILTGGDPLKRADLYDLIDEAHTLEQKHRRCKVENRSWRSRSVEERLHITSTHHITVSVLLL